jgi:hypothetical protein
MPDETGELAMYQSDITRFLQELKSNQPQLEAQQREGRAIWWDHPQDADISRRDRESRVAQKPYVYQTQTRA